MITALILLGALAIVSAPPLVRRFTRPTQAAIAAAARDADVRIHLHPASLQDPFSGWEIVAIMHFATPDGQLLARTVEHRWTPDDGHQMRMRVAEHGNLQ